MKHYPIYTQSPVRPIIRQPLMPTMSNIQQPQQTYSQLRISTPMRQSTFKTFQPYKPDPEVEKIIQKYSQSKISTPNEPITHSSQFKQSRPSEFTLQKPYNQNNQYQDQYDGFQDIQPMNSNINFDLNQQDETLYRGNYQSPQKYEDQKQTKKIPMQMPQQNDQIAKGAISGLIVLLLLYILYILFMS